MEDPFDSKSAENWKGLRAMSDYISGLDARMVLDSRGNPTIEVDCYVDGRLMGRAMVPSGASTGQHESLEMRDNDPKKWLGKGVDIAVENVRQQIAEACRRPRAMQVLRGLQLGDERQVEG